VSGTASIPEPIVTLRADGPDLDPFRHGAKAVGLQALLRKGLPVPKGIVVPIRTAQRIAAGQEAPDDLAAAVSHLSGPRHRPLAVRSGGPHSLPGALISVFDVEPSAVLDAVAAVVASARSPYVASVARGLGVPDPVETAVIIQRYVDPTTDERSGAGVATTCDPLDGRPIVSGSFAWTTAGAEVMAAAVPVAPLSALADRLPEIHQQLLDDLGGLAGPTDPPVEVEFVVGSGRLWYVQRRQFVVNQPDQPEPEPGFELGRGQPGSVGRGSGRLYVDVDDALDAIGRGESVVLALVTTGPGDIPGILGSAGLMTQRGGRDSHAAVVARSAGVPAVLGVPGLTIDPDGIVVNGHRVLVGEPLVVDGTLGWVGRPDQQPTS